MPDDASPLIRLNDACDAAPTPACEAAPTPACEAAPTPALHFDVDVAFPYESRSLNMQMSVFYIRLIRPQHHHLCR